MAAELYLIKTGQGTFAPADEQSMELAKQYKSGDTLRATFTKPRNIKFHKKYFALLNLGFEYWAPPPMEWRGIQAVKSFEVFREQVIILAGHREVTFDLKGNIKITAKSISFGKMSEDEFHELYKATFRVIWQKVLSNCEGWSKEEMTSVLANLENFA